MLCKKNPKQIFVDGFYKVPKDFKQLVNVFRYSELDHGAFAIFYYLLNFKTEDQYKLMFEEFKTILKSFHPDFIFSPEVCMTDYEKGLINAVNYSFPTSKNSRCFFQSLKLLKKNQSERERSNFESDKLFMFC